MYNFLHFSIKCLFEQWLHPDLYVLAEDGEEQVSPHLLRHPLAYVRATKIFLNLTPMKICVANQRRRDCRCRRTSWHSVRHTAWPLWEQALWSERENVPRPLFQQWLHRFWKPRSQCRREVVESANKISCSIICKIPAMCPGCYYLTLILSKATANAVATAAKRWA